MPVPKTSIVNHGRPQVRVGWPVALKRERVGIFVLDLLERGHLNVPLDRLPDFIKAIGYPQIAFAVEEQIQARTIARLINTEKDDRESTRQLVKQIIKEGQVNGR